MCISIVYLHLFLVFIFFMIEMIRYSNFSEEQGYFLMNPCEL